MRLREICLNHHAISLFFSPFCTCETESQEGAEEAWVGVNDSDIIAACRLVLFQCPDTDRSSIVPASRGLPRFPCVRNHPPTCCSRRGPQTMKPYTDSLWAAGRGLMKDSVTAERITNTRLTHTHTHTYLPRRNKSTHTHPCTRAQSRQTHPHTVTQRGQWEWRGVAQPDAWRWTKRFKESGAR